MDYLEWAKNRWQVAEDKDSATSAALIAIGEELRLIRVLLEKRMPKRTRVIIDEVYPDTGGFSFHREEIDD